MTILGIFSSSANYKQYYNKIQAVLMGTLFIAALTDPTAETQSAVVGVSALVTTLTAMFFPYFSTTF